MNPLLITLIVLAVVTVLYTVIAGQIVRNKAVKVGTKEMEKFLDEVRAYTELDPENMTDEQMTENIARGLVIAEEMLELKLNNTLPTRVREKMLSYAKDAMRRVQITSGVLTLISILVSLAYVVQQLVLLA
jgi:hypothetical protein